MSTITWMVMAIILIARPLDLDAKLSPEKIIVLANTEVKESLEIARYYMKKRNIPRGNLVALPMAKAEYINWNLFTKQIFNPLLNRCLDKGWIDGERSKQLDAAGRHWYTLYGNDIDFLVVCKGVPLKISHNPALMPEKLPSGLQKEHLTTQASVDSELSLLPFPNPKTLAYILNPLFEKKNPGRFTRSQILRVARLDGPTVLGVMSMIDNAIIGEKQGMMGRAYIDYGKKYAQGDDWLAQAQEVISSMGFPGSVDKHATLFGWNRRFDAPVLYFGWWNRDLGGPVSDPNFRFPPGAIGIHIHSYSGKTLRDPNKHWTGPLVDRGITGTVGNVFEPYLQLTHHPHHLMQALKAGMSFGEAAYFAQPAVSWQTIVVGDPLYQPFKRSLDDQLDEAWQEGSAGYTQYAVIRQMHLMKAQKQLQEAADYGLQMFMKEPGLALAYEIAQYYWELGDVDKAMYALSTVQTVNVFKVEDQGLAAEIARFLHKVGKRDSALRLYQNLLNDPSLNREIVKKILPDAINLATTLGEHEIAKVWRDYMHKHGLQL